MNITQLEKVVEKLRYYEIDKEIDDLPNYLKNLTPKELENIISMDFDRKHNEFSNIPWVEIFDNNYLLSFDNFYECLNIIFNELHKILNNFNLFNCPWSEKIQYSNELNGSLLFEILTDVNAQQNDYLLEDMKLILEKIKKLPDEIRIVSQTDISKSELEYFNATKELIKIMCLVATDKVSFEGKTHSKVMKAFFDMVPNNENLRLIHASRADVIADCLGIDRIFEASSDEKALAYTRVILNSDDADALDKIMFNARLFIDDQPDKNIELPVSVFKITQKNSS